MQQQKTSNYNFSLNINFKFSAFMIKCNVTVCGTISRTAQMRTGKEGKPFMSLGVNVVIPAKSGINKTVEISVAKDAALRRSLRTIL